jgi:tripartite-type tricarboxylate transporter receptor subunit TctC
MLFHRLLTLHVSHSLVRRCAALLAGVSLTLAAHAQAPYPNKPIRVVVPFAPGGATDIMARVVSKRLGEILGQTLVIDNKPGGNTALGADLVAKAPADGYTVLFTNDATFVLNPILSPQLNYNVARDFAPVATVAYLNLAMVVSSNLPVNNMAEMVSWSQAKSGTISYGSYGVGSQAHIMGEMYKKLTNTDIVHVPYKGSAPAVADVIGGQVVFTFPAIPTIQGFVQAGKLKVLAISGDKRSPLMPQVPTFTEAGYKDLNIGAWYAFLAPAQTPPAVVAKLNAAVASMLSSQEFVDQQLVPQGMSAMNMTPTQFGALIKSETDRMTRIIQLSGAKVE